VDQYGAITRTLLNSRPSARRLQLADSSHDPHPHKLPLAVAALKHQVSTLRGEQFSVRTVMADHALVAPRFLGWNGLRRAYTAIARYRLPAFGKTRIARRTGWVPGM
jgi:hypothetical protein